MAILVVGQVCWLGLVSFAHCARHGAGLLLDRAVTSGFHHVRLSVSNFIGTEFVLVELL